MQDTYSIYDLSDFIAQEVEKYTSSLIEKKLSEGDAVVQILQDKLRLAENEIENANRFIRRHWEEKRDLQTHIILLEKRIEFLMSPESSTGRILTEVDKTELKKRENVQLIQSALSSGIDSSGNPKEIK